jgi:translation elongation factor EF-Tu-like GTPase
LEGPERDLVAAHGGMSGSVMSGTLLDVFEISGRGCVVLVDVEEGDCRTGDRLIVGSIGHSISGIDRPRYMPETLQRIAEGWRPPLGLLLKDAEKNALAALIGQPCSTTIESVK